MRTLDGYFRAGGWRELVSQFGTPLVIVDAEIIRERCRILKACIPQARFYYALKANYNPWIVQIILNEGLGIDAVSPYEIQLAQALGLPHHHIIYVGNSVSDADLRFAMSRNIHCVIGSLSGLTRYCAQYPGTSIGVRINCDIGSSPHAFTFTAGPRSKFGIHHTDVATINEIASGHNVTIRTLHQHIGSAWLDVDPFITAIRALLSVSVYFPDVTLLDFGGGFGVPYKPPDSHINFGELGLRVNEVVAHHETIERRRFDIAFEPGRFLVAESSAILTTVHDKKRGSTGREFLGTDTGFGHLIRPALYDAYHRVINISAADRPARLYDVCGNLCEETDYLARDRELPQTDEGDILAVMDVGGYGMSQSTEYNLRPQPPEVIIDGDSVRIIRHRKDFSQTMSVFQFPFGGPSVCGDLRHSKWDKDERYE